MKKSNVTLEVKINGRSVREYSHEGKSFIEGRAGTSYSLHIHNENYYRVKAVVSVDGINIVSGKPVTDDPEETGYLLSGYQRSTFKGFRVSDNDVAAFLFAAGGDSYATSKGKGASNGVVALRVYREKEKPYVPPKVTYVPVPVPYYPEPLWPGPRPRRPYYEPTWINSTGDNTYLGLGTENTSYGANAKGGLCHADSMMKGGGVLRSANLSKSLSFGPSPGDMLMDMSADEPVSAFNLGTGWGDKVEERVTRVNFETGTLIAEITLYYSDLPGLEALGVRVKDVQAVAFPEAFERNGYCEPPSGWKG